MTALRANGLDSGTAHTFRDYTDVAVLGLLDGLLDLGNGADGVEVVLLRVFRVQFLLSQQEVVHIAIGSGTAGTFGNFPFQLEIDGDGGECHDAAERDDGQGELFHLFYISGHYDCPFSCGGICRKIINEYNPISISHLIIPQTDPNFHCRI